MDQRIRSHGRLYEYKRECIYMFASLISSLPIHIWSIPCIFIYIHTPQPVRIYQHRYSNILIITLLDYEIDVEHTLGRYIHTTARHSGRSYGNRAKPAFWSGTTYTCMGLYVYMYEYIQSYTHIHMYAQIYMDICIYTYIYVCTFTYT